MGNDIFGYKRNPKPDSVFSSEDSLLTFGNVANPIGYLVQNWQMQYQQQVTELFEIGSNALYWAKGRPVGNGALGRIIGKEMADSDSKGFFPSNAYDLCKGGETVKINAQSGGCAASGSNPMSKVNITMEGVVVTSIGFSMRVPDVMINENIGWRFAKLEIS